MFLILTILLSSLTVHAESVVFEPVMIKHKEKVQRRWTLEDWLSLKKRRKAQDNWLAFNSKKKPIFEMILDMHGGGPSWKRDGTNPDDKSFKLVGAGIQFFLGPIGIGISREQEKIKDSSQYWQKDAGSLYVRLLGSSTQSTHFTLLGGQEKSDHDYYGQFDQTFYGALANLYLFRHLGLEGRYRLKNSVRNDTHKISSEDYYYGIFWELSILRVYLNYSQEFNRAKRLSSGVKDNERIHGANMGVRLYF